MNGGTLHGIFTARARQAAGRTAVEDAGGRLSYGELNVRANRLAHALIARGVRPETTVAICLERSVDLVAGILGILKAGGAYVPLDPTYPPERLQFMVADCAAHCIVTRGALGPSFPRQQSRLIFIDAPADEAPHGSEDPPDAVRPEHLAYIIYTSGSTGLPKGVLLEHRNVVNSLRGLEAAFPSGPNDAYLFKSNHTFDASLLELFGPMWHGGRTVIMPPGGERDPLAVLDAVARHRVTHLFFVTSMMEALLDMCPPSRVDTLRSLKHLLVGGEAMSPRLAARLRSLAGPVRVANVYGPTETAIICAAFPLDDEIEGRAIPIGTMLDSLSGRVLDEAGREAAAGTVGELHIGGASVARGYLNAPDLTRQRFIANPFDGNGRLYRTGDLCRVGADGCLEYVERVDRQIKIRGYRVELGEIEAHLTSHPDVRAAVVTATGSSGDLRLAAYYVAGDASLSVPAVALKRHLRRFLPDHMIPGAWLQMPELPVSDSGKVDRKALPSIVCDPGDVPADRSRSVAAVIAGTWAAELGTRVIAPDDDFFALGGHSLSAARVVVALREALGKQIAVTDLYAAPTLATFERMLALAPAVDAFEPGQAAAAAPQPAGVSLPLSYDQLGFWVLDKLRLPFLNVIARRRVKGAIDRPALVAALERVVTTHPALRARMGRWVPRQHIVDHCPVRLVERDYTAMDEGDRERAALASMDELARRSNWGGGDALVEVRLVKVAPGLSEVQIGMPHIASDEASGAILFDDLSRHYLGIVRREPYSIVRDHGFEAFVRAERAAIRGSLRRSAEFWERYLEDASPIYFPESEVLPPEVRAESVYVELPRTFIERLRQAGRDHGLGIAELLYAASLRAVERAAEPFLPGAARPILHAPRSARDRAAYDGAIGLFARIDSLKVVMDGADDLVSLARRVRLADLETAAHQRCPTMVKSAALHKRRWQSRARLCRAVARVATAVLPGADLDLEVALAQTRLAAMRMTAERDFSVGVNVLNSFVEEPRRELFGLPIAQAPVHPTYDPLFRRVLELYFLRDAGGYQLMLNGDLRPAFRRALGMAVRHEIEGLHAAA